MKENKGNNKFQKNKLKSSFKDILLKSKDNNSSTYLKQDLKDVKYFTYRKKGYYSITYTKGKDTNFNKTPVGNLGYYIVEEQRKDKTLSKTSFKGRGKKKNLIPS